MAAIVAVAGTDASPRAVALEQIRRNDWLLLLPVPLRGRRGVAAVVVVIVVIALLPPLATAPTLLLLLGRHRRRNKSTAAAAAAGADRRGRRGHSGRCGDGDNARKSRLGCVRDVHHIMQKPESCLVLALRTAAVSVSRGGAGEERWVQKGREVERERRLGRAVARHLALTVGMHNSQVTIAIVGGSHDSSSLSACGAGGCGWLRGITSRRTPSVKGRRILLLRLWPIISGIAVIDAIAPRD